MQEFTYLQIMCMSVLEECKKARGCVGRSVAVQKRDYECKFGGNYLVLCKKMHERDSMPGQA